MLVESDSLKFDKPIFGDPVSEKVLVSLGLIDEDELGVVDVMPKVSDHLRSLGYVVDDDIEIQIISLGTILLID